MFYRLMIFWSVCMKVKFFDCDPEIFKEQMQRFIETCAKNNPYAEMNKDQILAYLRRQRLKMYHEKDSLLILYVPR
jgi:hypothetical protein